ncbi:MAG: ketoacyl-ACP synthase III [Rickettsiales bacterium]|jgi:3-oxoacyl-[acyl-carrier-protein] synthase-3|nr:ketoacyl-ACP synthase III [Rickettsiales bacterium]
MKSSKIIGFSAYSPKKVLTNDDLSKIMDTNDEWITTRTGVKSRFIAEDNEQSSDMGVVALQKAMQMAGVTSDDVEMLIVSTATPDLLFPSTADIIQKKADLKNAVCFDVTAACAGFLYALSIANAYIKSGKYKRIAVVAAEKMTKLVDWTDRSTAVLFGDGAGCFILEASDEENVGILDDIIKSSGYEGDILSLDYMADKKNIHMQGGEVFKHAVSKMADVSNEILQRNNMTLDDVKFVIPHQANSRIVEAVAKQFNTSGKVINKVAHFANTSSASIPLALNELYEEGQIKKGDTLLLTALGAGITWGSVLIKI